MAIVLMLQTTRSACVSVCAKHDERRWHGQMSEWMNVKSKTLKNVKLCAMPRMSAGKGGTLLLALTSLIKQEISIIEFVLCFCFCMTTFSVLSLCFFFYGVRLLDFSLAWLHIECVCFFANSIIKLFFYLVFSSFVCYTIIMNMNINIIVILPKIVWHRVCLHTFLFRCVFFIFSFSLQRLIEFDAGS